MYVIVLALAALGAALAHAFIWGAPLPYSLLLWLLVIKIGLGGLWAFLGHYFKSDEVARYIGWPEGNPFQKEVAFANLALGTCGLLCLSFRGDFWLATIIFATVFLVGAFTVHVKSQRESGNKEPGNAGPVFFADILVPLVLWGLYITS
jgi:hypothetical protein